MEKFDIYQHVTDRILAALENGTAPWVKPWDAGDMSMPYNMVSKQPYHGINILLLWLAGYTSPVWGTFKQFSEKKIQIKKGEKATQILWASKFEKKVEEVVDGKTELKTKSFFTYKYYSVFNLQQTDYVFPAVEETPKKDVVNQVAVDYIAAVPADKRYGGAEAYFSPSQDYVQMPEEATFISHSAFYSTFLHELVHWTGHSSRLDREQKGFSAGIKEYAFEELVAELGSAFLCSSLGVSGSLQHENYIGAWIQRLQNDKKYIFEASKAANSAVEHLNGYQKSA